MKGQHYHKCIDIWIPIVGIPIGCGLAYWLFIKTQEWVSIYQIEPIVAFLGLNAIGIIAIYLGIKAIKWASKYHYAFDITTLKAVTKPPTTVSAIAQTKFPFRKSSHSTPASTQSPPHPSQAQTIMAIPKGNNIQPISLNKAVRNIYHYLQRLFHNTGVA